MFSKVEYLSSVNTSLLELKREMLWEPQAAGECFHSFCELCQLDRNTKNMFFISFRKCRDAKK